MTTLSVLYLDQVDSVSAPELQSSFAAGLCVWALCRIQLDNIQTEEEHRHMD